MNPRTIRALHVEDDALQQAVVARHLGRIEGLRFEITCATSEEQAVAEFARDPKDLVILDYHLTSGDGLSCLQRLRRHDRVVPILALSGQATDPVAARLLQSGADDYISKRDLTADVLARSVREALARADAWRRCDEGRSSFLRRAPGDLQAALVAACEGFTAAAGREFLSRLARCEAAAAQAGLTGDELGKVFARVCDTLAGGRPDDGDTFRQFLRPVLLELQARLAGKGGQPPPPAGAGPNVST